MTSPNRCAWTSRESERLVPVTVPARDRLARKAREETVWVLPEHADRLRRFTTSWVRWGRVVVSCLAILSATALLGAVTGGATLVGASVTGIGVLVAAFPFVSPETGRFVGMRRAIAIGRTGGLVVAALGMTVLALGP